MVRTIYNFKEELAKYGLTTEKYDELLYDCNNKVQKINDMDWSEIIEKYDLDFNPDTIRKASQPPLLGSSFVMEYIKWKNSREEVINYNSELELQKYEIRKEKQKLFDERSAINKTLREQGRLEENLSILERLVKENGRTTLSPCYADNKSSDNDMVICISDFHLGQDVDNLFGSYNSIIAKQRLSQYLEEIDRIRNLNKSENAYVFLLGDLISGEIHPTVQLENRENIAEQVQKSAELISSFTYELSKLFNNVYVNSVSGNHSRTGKKDEVLRTNRLDNLIPWYMKAKLSHLSNIEFVDKDNYDCTIGRIMVRGNEILGVHGDYDSFNECGISKLVMMLDHKPNTIVYGHLHHNSFDNIANVNIIRSGAFSGTGDDYTISKRITGNPQQMVFTVDENGIKGLYPIILH